MNVHESLRPILTETQRLLRRWKLIDCPNGTDAYKRLLNGGKGVYTVNLPNPSGTALDAVIKATRCRFPGCNRTYCQTINLDTEFTAITSSGACLGG